VGVYKNGVLIGAGPTTSFFVNRGGRIGAWRHQTAGALRRLRRRRSRRSLARHQQLALSSRRPAVTFLLLRASGCTS
jgi:hypothetical protein